MKKNYLPLVFIIFIFGFCSSEINEKNPAITAEEIKSHIEFLASDDLGGRFTGTEDMEEAAEYMKNDFEANGLKPLFGESYYQEYSFIAGLELEGDNSLEFAVNGEEIDLDLKEEFTPTPFSGNAEVKGDIVFAGYGISAPDLKYDDYEGIDVKGKTVLVMRYHPENDNPHSDFEKHAAFRYKINTAKQKGASAIIFVNGHFPKDSEDKLMKLRYDGAPGIESFSSVQIKRTFADQLFEAEGKNFSDIQKQIDSLKKPASYIFSKSKVELSTGVKQVEKTAINVGAFIEGSDNELKNEYIIIGAHYDHLGMGETGSLYRGTESQIHNGADDNASGTAGVLELAEKFSSNKNNLKRSIVFLGFSGEELGLLGSAHYVDDSPLPLDKASAMLNLDMVGRLNEEKSLIVYGTGTSSIWKDMLNKHNENFKFKLGMNDEGFGPSDQSSFYGKTIPVLFFFTGTHTDYHRPSDDADKINSKGEEDILNFVYNIAEETANKTSKADYVNVPRKDTGGPAAFRVYVGTIPDYSGQANGFRITGVSEGSPAQKGGLKAGDVIISFGGKKVTNIYDYMYAMNEFNPGDVVEVVVVRDNKEVPLKVELGAR